MFRQPPNEKQNAARLSVNLKNGRVGVGVFEKNETGEEKRWWRRGEEEEERKLGGTSLSVVSPRVFTWSSDLEFHISNALNLPTKRRGGGRAKQHGEKRIGGVCLICTPLINQHQPAHTVHTCQKESGCKHSQVLICESLALGST